MASATRGLGGYGLSLVLSFTQPGSVGCRPGVYACRVPTCGNARDDGSAADGGDDGSGMWRFGLLARVREQSILMFEPAQPRARLWNGVERQGELWRSAPPRQLYLAEL